MDQRKEKTGHSTKLTELVIMFSITSGSHLAYMHSLPTSHQESAKTILYLIQMYIPSRTIVSML